jgi:hypothetical protein
MGRLLRGLLQLLHLLLSLRKLRSRLLQRDILHQHRLRENVNGISVAAETALQQRRRIRIFFRQLRGIYPLDERVQHLFFL